MSDSSRLIEKLHSQKLLSRAESEFLMEEILSGRMETPEIIRLLDALKFDAVTADQLAGFATVMRSHAAPVFSAGAPAPENMVDTCGTGGDSSGTFNISTAAAIVAAAAGVRIAKHGNRAATSSSGSADVLEALGVFVEHSLLHAGQAIRELGIGFLFAPTAHAAARHAAPARKQIGRRTVFNLLGPLTNPAGAQAQVLGVFSADVIDVVVEALKDLLVQRAFVLHGAGGLDEISLEGETQIAELSKGGIRRFTIGPEDFGLNRAPLAALRGGTPQENATIILQILDGQQGAPRDIVIANAAAAILISGAEKDFRAAAARAGRAIDSGAARAKLENLKSFTNRFRS